MESHLPNFSLFAIEITGPYIVQLISRVLHILSAVILVGGLFYLRTVLAPAGEISADDRSRTCFGDRRGVWAKWVGLASAFLIVSGLYNLMTIMGQAKADGVRLPPTYHMLFGIKFLLALLVMFISAILAGKTPLADRFRGQMRKWLNIGWLAALATIVLASILRTLH